jgi:hypothetical protein
MKTLRLTLLAVIALTGAALLYAADDAPSMKGNCPMKGQRAAGLNCATNCPSMKGDCPRSKEGCQMKQRGACPNKQSVCPMTNAPSTNVSRSLNL